MYKPYAPRRWPRAGWLVETNGLFVERCIARAAVFCVQRDQARVFPRKWQAELASMTCDNPVLIRVTSRGSSA